MFRYQCSRRAPDEKKQVPTFQLVICRELLKRCYQWSELFYQFLMLVNAELNEFFHTFGPAFVQKIKIHVPVIRIKRKQRQTCFHQYVRMNESCNPAISINERVN